MKTNSIPSKGRNPIPDIGVHIADPQAHIMPDARVYAYGAKMVKQSLSNISKTEKISGGAGHSAKSRIKSF